MNLEQFEILNISPARSMISTSSQFLPISQDNPSVPALESIPSTQSEVICATQLSRQAEVADVGSYKEEDFDEVATISPLNCLGTNEYILPYENEEIQRKREKVREVKRERAMRKEEQLKETSKKRLSHHLQKMQVSNSQSVPVLKAPQMEVVCHKPKRHDAVSLLLPCQRKNYEQYMNKLQKENDRKRKEQANSSRSKEKFIQKGPQETKSYSEFLRECHPDFIRSTCKGGFASEMVCMESGCNSRAIHCANSTCKDCTEQHGLCRLKVNTQMFASTFEKNLERQSTVLRQYEYTEKSILEAIRRNRKLVMKLAMFQGADEELLRKLEQREKSNGEIHLIGNEVIGFLKSASEESRHRVDREIKVCESLIKSQHEILLNLDRHARMLIEPFQIADLTVLDSRLVRNKGEIRFILEELNFPLSLSLLYRASQHQFSISQFHEACDSQADTFTVIKTEHGKLIGGFTPLKWGDKTYRDKQNKTFLLAINLKERLDHINHGESAIHTDSSLGPSFGGIFDKRDIEVFQNAGITFCRTSFPNSFNWKKFFTPSQQSRRFLTGVEEGNACRVVDYEVFKVRPRIGQKL